MLPKALVLQDECFGNNYSPFLDFTRNYEQMSGIFVPCVPYLSEMFGHSFNQTAKTQIRLLLKECDLPFKLFAFPPTALYTPHHVINQLVHILIMQ